MREREGEKQLSKEDSAKLAAEVHSSEVNALCDDIGRQFGGQVNRRDLMRRYGEEIRVERKIEVKLCRSFLYEFHNVYLTLT